MAEGGTEGRTVSALTGESFRCHDVCVMCGVLLANDDGRRSKTVRTFLCMLESRWRQTPYVWSTLYELARGSSSPNHRLTACAACINWIRRSQQCGQSKVYLLIDRLINFSLAPGEMACPDMRNMRRLMACLLSETVVDGQTVRNYYYSILPEHLRLALAESGGDVDGCIRRIVLRWFNDVNNRSPIFRHPNTAYIVRKALGFACPHGHLNPSYPYGSYCSSRAVEEA